MIKKNLQSMTFCVVFILSASVGHADYLTSYDFQNRLASMFSEAYVRNLSTFQGKCLEGLIKFGFASPATGKLMGQFPNSETIKTIQVCYTDSFTYSASYLSTANRADYIKFFSQFIDENILQEKLPTSSLLNSWHLGPVQNLSDADQESIIAKTLETMLGTDDVILSYGIIKNVDAYRSFLKTKVKPNQKIIDMISDLTKELALRNEFLTY